MIRQTPGKIFLAEQRGLLETSQFRRYSTFSFGPYAHEHKGPFGRLHALNEEMLAGGSHLKITAEQDAQVLILPITGTVSAGVGRRQTQVQVEEIQLLRVAAGSTICFTNPYSEEQITFLHIWLNGDSAAPEAAQTFAFSLPELENQLATVIPATDTRLFSLSLGRFAGRHEADYQLDAKAQLFTFVIAGAFEVEGRLLHEKDGLALWHTEEVELEALSNNALVLLLELKNNTQ
ncbi:hypothetical protein [Hymenobacter sediminicola]|uniref:Quercetin 2,3-dioxygenase C-terminal cupin domain-containing protein n=1 Tax=Hymenobacter sediminicola TaxID=2761579 RepID=A0A7G7WBB2_9BACT|nr:hypothetical protein [Hymenobacter sediminicola]QNH63655.1 hypothetical protein H4317_07625 [Hymenobacter sediminicola]